MDPGDPRQRDSGNCAGHIRRPGGRRGFTLVELLVVVAIIAILATIIVPTLSHAKEVARRAQCAGQLNAIGKAMAIYAAEQNGHIPVARDNTTEEADFDGDCAPYLIWQPAAEGGGEYVQFGLLVKQAHVDAGAFFCPNRDRWSLSAASAFGGVSARSFDPASAGDENLRSLSSYSQRDVNSGAPTSTAEAAAKAIMFDMHRDHAGGGRQLWQSHSGGINVLYNNSSVRFIAVEPQHSVDPVPEDWQRLDECRGKWSW